MRVLVQRVRRADVSVKGEEVAAIKQGLLLFVAIAKDDTKRDVDYLSEKIINLRIFSDESAKMNLAVRAINGQILSIPQFTLYAQVKKGNRPGFDLAAEPIKAKKVWQEFNSLLAKSGGVVKVGIFGENMQVSLVNDGPVTIWIDSKQSNN